MDQSDLDHQTMDFNQTHTQQLKALQDDKKHEETEAEDEKNAELSKVESEAAVEKERALQVQTLAANHQAEAKRIEAAVQSAVESAIEEKNKLLEQEQE